MSVTLSLFAGVGAQFLDNNGNILSGGLIYTYSAGTTTPLATYTSNLGTVAQPNPIVLDSAGRIPGGELWLTTGYGYKFVTKDSNGVLIGTYDNVPSSAQPPITNDASSIAYEQGAPTIAGSFVIGDTYLITSIGTTNFQTIGAASNTVGIHFIATGVGSGTGTAQFTRTIQSKLQDQISVKDFGAVGDGITDDTVAIQNTINWVVYQYQIGYTAKRLGSVYIPEGQYLISDTLQLGYGEVQSSVYIYGDGKRFRNNNNRFCGTVITPTFNDRPVFAVNTGIYTTIKKLSIVGLNYNWIINNNLGYINNVAINDLVASNWVDPSFPSSASSRYAPYCAIAIDPYAGSQPTVHYPNVTFPSWSGITTQYGKGTSTETLIEEVDIAGFVIGIVSQPNFDGNGDFTKILQCQIQECQYGVSIGNSEARLTRISNCRFNQVFTCVVTDVNGSQLGFPQILCDSTCFDYSIYWMSIPNTSFGGSPHFLNCYGEGDYSIGKAATGNAGQNADVLFESCFFSLTGCSNRGIPTTIFTNYGSTTFKSCSFLETGPFGFPNIMSYSGCYIIQFENCTPWANLNIPRTNYLQYQQIPINATGGIVFGNAKTYSEYFKTNTSWQWDLNTHTTDGSIRYIQSSSPGSRQYGIPLYSKRITNVNTNNSDVGFAFKAYTSMIDKTSATSISISGRTVTIDLTGAIIGSYQLTQYGGDVGDIVIDDATKAVFLVSARTGSTITLIAESGYDVNGNLLNPVTIGVGYLYALNCRLYTFGPVTYGTYTSGNGVITNVQDPTGYSAYIDNINQGVQINDYLFVDPTVYNINDPTAAQITGIDSTAKTITLNSNFSVTESNVRQTVFIRQSPANNT